MVDLTLSSEACTFEAFYDSRRQIFFKITLKMEISIKKIQDEINELHNENGRLERILLSNGLRELAKQGDERKLETW